MMRLLIGLLIILTLGCFVMPLTAEAQPPSTVYRIGRLSSGHRPAGPDPNTEAFRQALRDLGWMEGQHLAFESRDAAERTKRLPDLAAELVQLPVHVLFAVGTAAIRAAQQATRTIPLVMLVGGDPVGSGLITRRTRPGGNTTGLATLSPKLSAHRMALRKEVVPRVAQVAVFFNPDDETKGVEWHPTQVAARTFGLPIHPLDVRGPGDFGPAFAAMRQARTGGLIVLRDALTWRDRTRIVALAAEHRLPAIDAFREFVEAGGLMAYGPRLPHLFRHAASDVDRLLKGAQPADLPVEQPTTFELVLSGNTAQALGLTIPSSLLFLADEGLRRARRSWPYPSASTPSVGLNLHVTPASSTGESTKHAPHSGPLAGETHGWSGVRGDAPAPCSGAGVMARSPPDSTSALSWG